MLAVAKELEPATDWLFCGAEALDVEDAAFNFVNFQSGMMFFDDRKMVEAELRGWLPMYGIFLSEDKINEVLIESDKTLSSYAGPSGEVVFPTSAHLFTAKQA